MQRLIRRRPSAATPIALVALFVALGGSAYAASQVTGADVAPRTLTWRNIQRRSIGYGEVARLTGQNVRKSSMGGWQVDESTLAKVPSAARADTAATATKADTATNATTAANANALGGKAPSAYLGSDQVLRVGLVKLTDGQSKVLYKSGPLTLTAKCTINVAGDDARIVASSSEDHSALAGKTKNLDLGPATPEASALAADTGSNAHGSTTGDTEPFELTAPSGATLHGTMSAYANALGGPGACQFTGFGVLG